MFSAIFYFLIICLDLLQRRNSNVVLVTTDEYALLYDKYDNCLVFLPFAISNAKVMIVLIEVFYPNWYKFCFQIVSNKRYTIFGS